MNRRMLLSLIAGLALPAAHAESGVAGGRIVFGQSAPLSGPNKALGAEYQVGIQAAFREANAKGGVNGYKLELETADDGYEPERAKDNVRSFIKDGRVFALLGTVGTPTNEAILPLLGESGLPLVAPMTGAESLRKNDGPTKNIFHLRASYGAEAEKIVDHYWNIGLRKPAMFYQNDGFGRAGLAGVEAALKSRGATLRTTGAVERNSVNVSAAVKAIGDAQPDYVVMACPPASCGAFIKAMKDRYSFTQFVALSFVGSHSLSLQIGEAAAGVGVSQVVPSPWDARQPIVREYQSAMLASSALDQLSFVSLEGYIAARTVIEAIKSSGKTLTREKFVASLERMHQDLGGFSVDFAPQHHAESRYVELTMISKDGKIIR